ncbi:NAD(P)/FAD-dependent oxidoreductase [Halodurantibacterium flavum]|uniref:NAD(P)/FAD-dependent oxidoreductase n=1 Tax=Halodurantibacterium flavum TaxID=1382802 RepID=A0ABW4S124_9RHOB
MKPDVMVLGAGMVGVCTALHLQARGHDAVLIDRRDPGQETSFGNAGIIQREAVEPYAFPRTASAILRAALRIGPEVNYHLRALPGLAGPLLDYWRFSAPARYGAVASAHARLIEHCLRAHAPLIEAAGAGDLVRRDGFRFVFRTTGALDAAAAAAEGMARDHGLACTVQDGAALHRAEPALTRPLAGALHWHDPWTVRAPGELVARYADLFRQRGGTILRGDATSLARADGGWSVTTGEGRVTAGQAVIALGPWAADLTRSLGYRLPLFVKRGYHRHYHITGTGLDLPMLDAERGAVLAPMAQGLRISTGAEFALRDAPSTPVQSLRAAQAAAEIVDLGQPVEAEPWRGARPCTADMLPVVGPAPRDPGLWFNFGHAHQGFTLGPVTGQLLAEMIAGDRPFLDPAPYAATRFNGAR